MKREPKKKKKTFQYGSFLKEKKFPFNFKPPPDEGKGLGSDAQEMTLCT